MSERMSEERGGERGGRHDRRDISILSDSQRPRSAAPPLCAFLKHPSQCLIISVQYHCWMLIGSPAAAVYGPFKGPQLRITLPNFGRVDVEMERERFLSDSDRTQPKE